MAIRQTCGACPAQWEGTLDDGRMIYIRYRWGFLSLRVSAEPTEDVFQAVGGQQIFGEQIGDEYHGVIEETEVRERTEHLIEWGGHRD